MPCYPCSHCNKCGIFSLKLDLRCSTCGEPVVPGTSICGTCSTPLLHNMKAGKAAKPEDAVDYYTVMEAQAGK